MQIKARIVAGTALALVMTAYAGAPAGADTLQGRVLLAQAAEDAQPDEEELRRRAREAQAEEAEEAEPEEPAAEEPTPEPEPEPAPEEPAAEEPAPDEAPAEPAAPAEPEAAQPAQDEAPAAETDEETDRGAEPIPGQPAPPPPADAAPQPPTQETPPPADGGAAEPIPGQPVPPPPADAAPQPPAQETPPPADDGVEPVREAPLLDSEKEEPAGEAAPEPSQQPAEAAPPPVSDQEAQQFEEPVEVESLRAEEGRRIDRREERRERREGTNVLREIGDRIVLQLENQVVVRSDDRGRLERDASEVYYEELPRGRTRETVVRANGVQVVTVYDRYGDVIRRSRIMPDGREHVLVYAGDRDRGEERRQWRDPGRDLPPLRLNVPRDQYILDAGRVRDERAYYDFLAQPPVDRVRRPYSVDEVRYSARIRDIARRVDLDTITFDFGSATISEAAIPRLAGVADAMERLLDTNPGEMFLIEGHTDAVGSDEANLALSDRRAEAIASAMTNVFGIPPENLVTQGYGERYLKIATQEPERENRRVAIRRITPLVAPVASAQ